MLAYLCPDVPLASIFPDNETLITNQDLNRLCAQIAKFNAAYASTFRKFAKRAMAMMAMFVAELYAPPLPWGPFMAMLDIKTDGREMLGAMIRSCLDIVTREFRSDRVKIRLLKLVSENLKSPNEIGMGIGIFVFPDIIRTIVSAKPWAVWAA